MRVQQPAVQLPNSPTRRSRRNPEGRSTTFPGTHPLVAGNSGESIPTGGAVYPTSSEGISGNVEQGNSSTTAVSRVASSQTPSKPTTRTTFVSKQHPCTYKRPKKSNPMSMSMPLVVAWLLVLAMPGEAVYANRFGAEVDLLHESEGNDQREGGKEVFAAGIQRSVQSNTTTPHIVAPDTFAPTARSPSTFAPTTRPTVSPKPTFLPTAVPTQTPTLEVESISVGFYQQDIIVNEDAIFTELQTLIFEDLYQSYTPFYGPGEGIDPDDDQTIQTTCDLMTQSLLDAPIVATKGNRRLGFSLGTKWRNSGYFSSAPEHRALQQTAWKLRVGFSMTWRSKYINVETSAEEFATFLNANLTGVTEDMITSGLKTVTEAQEVFMEQKTPDPTFSPSSRPSLAPSPSPSASPTYRPTTIEETGSYVPSTSTSTEGLSGGAIGGIVIGVFAAAFIIGQVLYRTRKQRVAKARQQTERSKKERGGRHHRHHTKESQDLPSLTPSNVPIENIEISASEGKIQKATSSGAGSSDRRRHPKGEQNGGQALPNNASNQVADTTDDFVDEFDKYKDHNLEKMRTQVEGAVADVGGMMSHAFTKTLMDDDDSHRDMNELMWGGSGSSVEIEASVLCDVNDWLKKKEGASIDERREFMKETLNKMVASVRHGIISPEDASRTIHECAAMLGLQIAETIPETALIVTGMRRMVKTKDVIEAFKEFGEIEDAAVSPNPRGFGLVRFLSPKSVLRAMDKFRKEEIVVQDVAVMIKVLKSEDMDMAAFRPPTEGDMNRQFSSGQGRAEAVPTTGGPARMESSRASAMEAHHAPNLDTIGYPGDSIGRAPDGRGGQYY